MLSQHLSSSHPSVPRYTSYPTAPHFKAAVGAKLYASWLDTLPASDSLSVYLHVPFCEKLCLYCGCHTKAVRQFAPVEAYAELLVRELSLVAARTGSCRISHIHWGGGTPSILGPNLLCKLMAELNGHFDLTSLREHAIELDPRFVTRPLAEALADTLAVFCSGRGCNHEAILDLGQYPNWLPVPSFGPRMVCSACGAIGADARPNWNERAPPSLFGTRTG